MKTDLPTKVSDLLRGITESYLNILGENLVGIYVHGSLAFGCFTKGISDVDYIAVVKTEPSSDQKTEIIKETLRLEEQNPPKGLEMHVLALSDCQNFVHPSPFLLHYSAFHKERAKNSPLDFALSMRGTDPDLAAHVTVMNAVGFPIYGEPVGKVFSPVSPRDYLDSIMFDVASAAEEITENPVYFTLNLCRVLAFVKEQKILSKADGGKWGLRNLPQDFHELINSALCAYRGTKRYSPSPNKEKAFARFILEMIGKSTKTP